MPILSRLGWPRHPRAKAPLPKGTVTIAVEPLTREQRADLALIAGGCFDLMALARSPGYTPDHLWKWPVEAHGYSGARARLLLADIIAPLPYRSHWVQLTLLGFLHALRTAHDSAPLHVLAHEPG